MQEGTITVDIKEHNNKSKEDDLFKDSWKGREEPVIRRCTEFNSEKALLAKPRFRIRGGEIATFVERVTKLCNIEEVLTNNTKWKKNEHVSLE